MSRAWKSPNHSLPGWPDYRPPEPKEQKQHRSNRRPANKKRVIWRARAKETKRFARLTRTNQFKQVNPRPHQPYLEKLLRVEMPTAVVGAVFARKSGRWSCISAAPMIDWMTRVAHIDLIHSWLQRNHYPFQWLASNTTNPPGGPTTPEAHNTLTPASDERPAPSYQAQNASLAQANNTAPSKNNIMAPGPGKQDQSPSGSPLAQTGLTTPCCLIIPLAFAITCCGWLLVG